MVCKVVSKAGLEPTRLSTTVFKTGAATDYATWRKAYLFTREGRDTRRREPKPRRDNGEDDEGEEGKEEGEES